MRVLRCFCGINQACVTISCHIVCGLSMRLRLTDEYLLMAVLFFNGRFIRLNIFFSEKGIPSQGVSIRENLRVHSEEILLESL